MRTSRLLWLLAAIVLTSTALLLSSRHVAAHASSLIGPTRAATLPDARVRGWFEVNEGQFSTRVDYVARSRNTVYLSEGDALLTVPTRRSRQELRSGRPDPAAHAQPPAVVGMSLVGRSFRPRKVALGSRAARVNYFLGDDRSTWRTNVRTYSRVMYEGVYPGIDLVYYFDPAGELEYDLIVAPRADPTAVRLRFDGAKAMTIDDDGNLVLEAGADRTIRMRKPTMYQVSGDAKRTIEGRYIMHSNRDVGFAIVDYDAHRPLWIDPTFDFSTYLGGSGNDDGWAISFDADGNTYVAGRAGSIDFPILYPVQSDLRGFYDAFVAKFDSTGAQVYSTYIGGLGSDEGRGIAVDAAGNAYVTGMTWVYDWVVPAFPTTVGACRASGWLDEVFVAKLDSAGGLIASTLLGGSEDDAGLGIGVDPAGSVYVTGSTNSPDFLTAVAFQCPAGVTLQATRAGGTDAFVTKLNPALTAIEYSTFIGGGGTDIARGVAIDAAGRASIAGSTTSTNFPTANAFRASRGGPADAFVARLNAAGSAFVFSTYFGGSSAAFGTVDEATAVAVDAAGDTVIAGFTDSPDLPTVKAFQTHIAGPPSPVNGRFDDDGFVARFGPSGALVQSTYLGGNGLDRVQALSLGHAGSIVAAGLTRSADFPLAGDEAALTGDVGVYRSTDGGVSWAAARNGLGSPSVTAIAVDPAVPSTVYVGTEKNGVFKSTDGGVTWGAANSGLTHPFISALAIDPIATSTVYAATAGGGVFKSIDGGSTWFPRNNGLLLRNMISLAIDPASPSNLYAGTLSRGFGPLYKSADGGATWISKPGFGVVAVAVDPVVSATVYAASSVRLSRSLDGGTTWAVIFTEPTSTAPVTAVLVDPTRSSTIYLGTEGRGVYKTTDGGTTWQSANAGLGHRWVTSLAVAATQPNTVYAGTSEGVFKTDDGGATWQAVRAGIADVFVNQVAIGPNAFGAQHVLVAADGLQGDAFASALDYEGHLLYSTFLGGREFDLGAGLAVQPSGTLHLTGRTRSSDWPVSPAAVQAVYGGGFTDGFVSRIACPLPLALSMSPPDPPRLWPPYHQMERVAVDYSVAGCQVVCGVSVSSTEPENGTGDGDAAPDWEVLDTRSVLLRAERAGTGGGRVYTITTTCTDSRGRQTSGSREVRVPFDMR